MVYNAVDDNTGLSLFVQQLLPPKSPKSCEILQKFELIGHQNFWMKLVPQTLEGWGCRMVKIAYPDFIVCGGQTDVLQHIAR